MSQNDAFSISAVLSGRLKSFYTITIRNSMSRVNIHEKIYVICRKSKWTYLVILPKRENRNTSNGARILSRKSLTRSLIRDRVCRAPSSSGTKVYSHSSCSGRVHAPTRVYLLRFPKLRDRDADGTVRDQRRDIFWCEFTRALAIWDGHLAKLYEARRSFRYWYDRSKWFPLHHLQETALFSEGRQHFLANQKELCIL